MKKTIFGIAFLAVLALNLSVAAMVKADFSGAWKLDAAKSTGLPPGMEQTMTVTQTGDTVKLETVVKGGPQGDQTVADGYTLDEKEHEFKPSNIPDGKGKRVAKWSADGNGIEVNDKVTVETEQGAMTIEYARKWTLSSDGKILTIEMKVKTPQGEQEIKRTFVKQ